MDHVGIYFLFAFLALLLISWCHDIYLACVAKIKALRIKGRGVDSATIGSPEQLQRYVFSKLVRDVFDHDNPALTPAQGDLAFYGLREFFLLLRLDGNTPSRIALGMPSVLVDAAWHAFVLCTEEYEAFCLRYFGKMIHHRPDPSARPTTMQANSVFSQGTMNIWSTYRRLQGRPGDFFRLSLAGHPFIFEIDSIAGLVGGWHWTEASLAALDSKVKRTSNASLRSAGGTATSLSSDFASSNDYPSASGHSCSTGSHSGGHSCSSGSSCGSSCGGGASHH